MGLERRGISFVLVLFSIFIQKASSSNIYHYGVLTAESSTETQDFCIKYFPEFSDLPDDMSQAEFHRLEDASSLDLCDEITGTGFDNRIILANYSSCSLVEQARNVQEKGGIGAVFIASNNQGEEPEVNDTSTDGVNITVALISKNLFWRLMKMQSPVSAKMFSLGGLTFDYSWLIILIVAMFTVATGSFWSGVIHQKLHSQEISKLTEVNLETASANNAAAENDQRQFQEESSLNISLCDVCIYVVCVSATLLLLYFFFDYLVHLMISIFVIVVIHSVFVCLQPIVNMIIPRCCSLFELRFRNDVWNFDIRHLLLLCVGVSMSLTWVFTRKENYSWILQDILGVLVCINLLKNIRLPNLKICTVLLSLLFLLDIFFVFVTPLFTTKGRSIMEEVATGGKSTEKLRMVLQVPAFGPSHISVCYKFSVLGFGDIFFPGLLVSFCHSFDLISIGRRLYFFLTVFTYGIGLILTFVAAHLMTTAQPALLYLVPCTLLPVVILGWRRGELKSMWQGFKNSCDEVAVIETVAAPTVESDVQTAETSEVDATSQLPLTASSN